jgi:hypothetical protein
MDPNAHPRFGYITQLNGFGLAAKLTPDLIVGVPYNGATPAYKGLTVAPAVAGGSGIPTATVVGVLEKFSWAGGVGDFMQFDFYVSQQSATLVKALQQMTLKNTKVTQLGWWIADYDQEAKQWFEQCYPLDASGFLTGQINNKDNPELNVDMAPVKAKDGIDVNVYKISMQIAPGANLAYTMHHANSSSMKVVKSWGLVVGGAQGLAATNLVATT